MTDSVPVEHTDDGDRRLWTYTLGPASGPTSTRCARRPARVLTRDAPDDHPWHHGLWFTIKFVNDENFWEETTPTACCATSTTPRSTGSGPTGRRWSSSTSAARPTSTSRRRLRHRPRHHPAPAVDGVLDRTPFTTWGGYGGLALRGRAT